MKRMLVCTLLAGAFVLAVAPIAAQSETSSAAAVVKRLYVWYLVQPNHEWTDHLGQVKALFDPGLYAMFETVLHSEANQKELRAGNSGFQRQ
jgi:hypothetical protein